MYRFPPDYMAVLTALSDAPVDPEALDLAVPLSGRWPEPRIFWQDRVFYLPDRTQVDLDDDVDPDLATSLLEGLHSIACCLHGAAVKDEQLTTSSGDRLLLQAAGVPPLEEIDPTVWLESTALVRRLRAIQQEATEG